MIQISESQLARFDESHEQAFQRRVLQFLDETLRGHSLTRANRVFQWQDLTSEHRQRVIASLVSRARSDGLENEDAVVRYVMWALLVSADFWKHPKIQSLLGRLEPDGADELVELLPSLLTDSDIQELQAEAHAP